MAENLCTSNETGCFIPSCVQEVVSGIDAWYRCWFGPAHNTSPGTWQSFISVSDGQNTTTATDNEWIETTLSASFAAIDFSSQSLGFQSASSDNASSLHINGGNITIDFLVAATSPYFSCSTGTFELSAVKFGTADVGWTSNIYSLSTTSTTMDLNLEKTGGVGNGVAESFWDIKLPSTGLLGSCSATIEATTILSV